MFGEKHVPNLDKLYLFSVPLKDYRKCSYPISTLNSTSLLCGVAGAAVYPGVNIGFLNRPALASAHRSLALGVFGVWMGYYLLRTYEQYYFGRFKYCIDYALNRKDIFTKEAPMKYSDPGVLRHWRPVR
uniref:Uncharacterized protein LOC100175877 n=1 Tax=Phallusia mammillata TaxID=59560 RepID=A0A6F9DH84_9ASCI|nr:uncharacterized protein LOC100175877 [Phallusia mammillata]